MDTIRDPRGDAAPAAQPSDSGLLAEVLARWPTAPVAAVGDTGRWLTFERSDGGTLYLQRYAWDDRCLPFYFVVRPADGDGVEQHRCRDLDDAIATAKRLLVSRPTRQSWSDALARLVSPGDHPLAAA